MKFSQTAPPPARRHPVRPWIVPCIIALGLGLRLLALRFFWHAPLVSDAQDYVNVARRLLSGEHFVPYWPPGLPLFLAPLLALHVSEPGLRVAMLLWWALATWGMLRLAAALELCTRIPLRRYVPLPLLVFTLLPASIHLSVEPLTQLPVAALLLLSLSAALNLAHAGGPSRAVNIREGVLLGLSTGTMALIRPSAMPLVLLLPALMPIRRPRWRLPVASALLGAALVGGWMIRAHTLSGAWIINIANAQNLWDGNNPSTPLYRTWFFGSHAKPGSDEIHKYPLFEQTLRPVTALPPLQQPHVFQRLALDHILHHPGLFLLRTLNRMRAFFGFDTFTSLNLRKLHPHHFLPSLALEALLYLLLMVPSVFCLAGQERGFWRHWSVLTVAGTLVLYAAPYWASMSHPTYHYPVLAPLALLGTLAWAWSRFFGKPLHRTRGWLAVGVLLLIQLEWIWQAGSAAA